MSDRAERGSVSIVVAAVATFALVASLGVADVGKALVARARARAAADAAALAAAQQLAVPGAETPFQIAASYAARNGGTLVSCTCAAGSLEAIVEVGTPVGSMFLVGDALEVRARARAVIDLPVG